MGELGSNELDLEAIEARERAATAGPWAWRKGDELRTLVDRVDPYSYGTQIFKLADLGHPELETKEADLEFIAHAREHVPALVKRVRELEAECLRWTAFGRLVRSRVDDATLETMAAVLLGGGHRYAPSELEHIERLIKRYAKEI